MGNELSTVYLEPHPPWQDYVGSEWRSERCRELDRLGGLNRPPIPRGQSFTAKLQFLAEVVKKQGDEMQELLLPPPAPKQEAKYSGFMLATERRAHERMAQEQDRAARIAHIAATEGPEAAAAALAAMHQAATVYDRGGATRPSQSRDSRASAGSARSRPSGVATSPSPVVAQWRIHMWQARRRVMIIVLTVLRLRRGKLRYRAGNKLDNLGFLIPRMLADDVGRFVDEQRKYATIKEDLESAKQALDDLLCRNGASTVLPPAGAGVLAEEGSMWSSQSQMNFRQGSMARPVSTPSSGVLGGQRGLHDVHRSSAASRGSDSGVLAAVAGTLGTLGISPMRGGRASRVLAPVVPPGPPVTSGATSLGIPGRPSASALNGLRLGMGSNSSSNVHMDLTPPDSPMHQSNMAGPGHFQNGAAGSPKSRPFGILGPLGNLIGGGGSNRRNSTPGRFNSPQHESPTGSREPSMTQMNSPPMVPQSPSRGRPGPLPPTPTSVTAQVASAVGPPLAVPVGAGGFSSMAARRMANRPPGTPPAGPQGLGTIGPTGPLNARVSVTSAVAAKHGQIMAVQAQVETESSGLKKSGQMLSMFVNRANAAWAEGQSWGTVDAPAVSELQAFRYSEQYRIYQADLVRRLRQGSICLQFFAGDDVITGNEKRLETRQDARPSSGRDGLSSVAAVAGALTHLEGHSHHHAGGPAQGAEGGSGRNPRGPKGVSAATSNLPGKGGASGTAGAGPGAGQSKPSPGGGGGGAANGSGNNRVKQLLRTDSGASTCSNYSVGSLGHQASISQLTPRRRQQDLWTADPWELIDRFRPGIMPQTDRIQGPTLGARILIQLALCVESLAGTEALATLPVLLHINEDQMEEVVQELWSYKFFGLKRENVMLVASPLHTGYRYNHEFKVFEKEYGTSVAPLGSGYSMLQLTWAGEAFIVGPEGAPEPLDTPALVLLQANKVEWLVSRRARDLALLNKEAVLDVPMLAYCMALKDRSNGLAGGASPAAAGRANIVMEVTTCDSLVDARALDSFVMRRTDRGGATPAVGMPEPAQPSAVVELRLAELGTPKMTEALNYLRAVRDGQVTIGLGRYLLHVPSLAALMPNASALRPKLSLHEELVRVSLDLGDLTAAPKARTLAVHGINAGALLSADDLDRVIPLLQAQDHDAAFRDMLAANRSDTQSLSFVASTAAAAAGGAQVIVVFVAANRVSALAVDAAGLVARPGRDVIHLVTCVSSDLQRSDAEEMLRGFQKRLLKSMVDTHIEVLVRGVWGLIDVMDNYVNAVDARMAVMASQHLTSNAFNYVIGSITLSALKRLHVPVMVVTANSRQNLAIGGEAGPGGSGAANGAQNGGGGGGTGAGKGGPAGLRCLTLVENHARSMVSFLCSRLLDHKRGDRMLLAQVQATRHLTRQQAASVRRSVDNFTLLAGSHGFTVSRVLALEGALDEVLGEAVAGQHIQLLGVSLQQGAKTLPPVLVSLLRSCRGATLVFKEPVGGRPVQPAGPRAGMGPGSAAASALAAATASAAAAAAVAANEGSS